MPLPPPADVTDTVTDVLCCTLPSVPVTVTVYEPVATDEPTETVSVDELPAVTEVGFSEAVGPEGDTLADRLTVPAEPLVTAVLMVAVPLLPCWMDSDVGLALIEKSLPPEEPPAASRARFHTSGEPMPLARS